MKFSKRKKKKIKLILYYNTNKYIKIYKNSLNIVEIHLYYFF